MALIEVRIAVNPDGTEQAEELGLPKPPTEWEPGYIIAEEVTHFMRRHQPSEQLEDVTVVFLRCGENVTIDAPIGEFKRVFALYMDTSPARCIR